MSAIVLNGEELIAEPSGALWWPSRQTLVVADLHLEKGSSFASRGTMLPPYDTVTTLDRLAAALRPEHRRVICLGDSFHDDGGAGRLSVGDATLLMTLMAGRDWIWIAGNHDAILSPGIGGQIVIGELAVNGLVFRHIARLDAEPGEISGHYHPKATVHLAGRRFSGPCFAHDRRRLILPALGAYTGGLNVNDPAIRALFSTGFTVDLIARRRLLRVPQFSV